MTRAKPGKPFGQPGRVGPARVDRVEVDAAAPVAALPLLGQHHLGALGPCVSNHAVVDPPRP